MLIASQEQPCFRKELRISTRLVCTPPCGGGYGPIWRTLMPWDSAPVQPQDRWLPAPACAPIPAWPGSRWSRARRREPSPRPAGLPESRQKKPPIAARSLFGPNAGAVAARTGADAEPLDVFREHAQPLREALHARAARGFAAGRGVLQISDRPIGKTKTGPH